MSAVVDVPPPATEPAVRLIPLGGLGEIGLNMMLLESGDDLIAVDCGLMFPDPDEMPGIDHVIPDFSYALAKREGFRAVFLTHERKRRKYVLFTHEGSLQQDNRRRLGN